jgi:hypothetical protein
MAFKYPLGVDVCRLVGEKNEPLPQALQLEILRPNSMRFKLTRNLFEYLSLGVSLSGSTKLAETSMKASIQLHAVASDFWLMQLDLESAECFQ